MLVAGFDLETTGLDTANDQVIEVGAVLWDTERRAPAILHSALVRDPVYRKEPLPAKIVELTGITDFDLARYGRAPSEAYAGVAAIFHAAEAVVAHNGNLFDKPMWEANVRRQGFDHETLGYNPKRLWVDTSCDIEFPAEMKTRKLKHLAAEHGFLNPFAHRALFDVLTMLKICDQYDWNKTLASARTPNHVVQAVMPFTKDEMFVTKKAAFEKVKEAVKGHGFRFEPDEKIWIKTIKEYNKDAAKAEATAGGYTLKLLKKEEPNGN